MAGVKRIGQYVLGETLGKGSFGKVKKAEHAATKHVVAVKILNQEQVKKLDLFGKIKREVQILRLFRHPHIIKLYQVVSSPTDIFLVMEYVSGGELFEYILRRGRLSEKEARRFFQQIISGVDYCHRHMVVHRDLKPENLLLDNDLNVKIADFGLSNMMTDGQFLSTSCGSPNYAAPEVISGKPYAGPEVDVWSCGVILYVLLCGKLPFDDQHVPTLFKKIRRGVFSIPSHLSSSATDLVQRMLKVDPLERMTIAQIREHPWFKQDLPENIFVGEDPESQTFDDTIIKEICQRFQVYRDHVVDALQSRDDTNQLALAYKLILHNRQLQGGEVHVQPEELEVSDEVLFSYDQALRPPLMPDVPPVTRQTSAEPERQLILPNPPRREIQSKFVVKRSRWHLGMRSKNHPSDIMAQVYATLQKLNFQWKVITPYHIRCRCWNQVSGTMMKMSLQLFAADKGNHLLDFQNLPTKASERLQIVSHPHEMDEDDDAHDNIHTLEFFELCAMVVAELVGR